MQRSKQNTQGSVISSSHNQNQKSAKRGASAQHSSSLGAHQSEQSKFQERGVPQPKLGPQGEDLNKEAGPRKGAGARKKAAGQVHDFSEDPYAILEGNKPYHEMLEQLRDSYIVYKESCSQCKVQLKPKQVQEQFKKYYFQPKVPFLEDPEKQKVYRKNLISEVSRMPEPEPLYLLADQMQLDMLETVGDRSNPATMREDLARFFLRRTAQLQHKKHKLLVRWANSQLRSPDLDRTNRKMDHMLSLLQQEQDTIHNRLERLIPDDKFAGAEDAERPSPTTQIKHQPSDAQESQAMDQLNEQQQAAYKGETTKLYIENTANRSVNSAIRQDDFEVCLRQKTYQNKLHRLAQKLVAKLKWLPLLKRYALWKESREHIFEMRQRALQERNSQLVRIKMDIKTKLERFGEVEEKAIMAVQERYIYHLKEDAFVSRMQQILQSHRTDVKRPPMLFASNVELNLRMETLAAEFPSLSCHQIEIDNGQQFTYQMQTLFPIEFEKQVVLAQFEREDSGHDPDRQLLERLVKSLELSRFEVLQEVARYAERQRRNSILGALGFDATLRQKEDAGIEEARKAASHDEFSEQNLLRKIKTIEFFSLNELKLKLRPSDWLEYVCFEAAPSEAQKTQNNVLSAGDNQVDHLLKGAFDAADIHDQVTVNKMLEEAAHAHIAKVQAIQHKIVQGDLTSHQKISGIEADTTGLRASLQAATKPESQKKAAPESALSDMSRAQMRRFEHIQNVDQLNASLVKNYYSLRLLKKRTYKQKLLSLVNYFRSVQRMLAFDLKEHVTREKALGERKDLIEPHFGRDADGKQISKTAPQTGPGRIFGINVNRKMDTADHDQQTDPVTLKCYKYGGLFQPQALSTSPMLPKYHRTFGRPHLYESVAQEVDRKSKVLHTQDEMQSLLVKRDRVVVETEEQRVRVFNEFGQPVLYSEALSDMVALEEELVKIGSYFINRHEYIQATSDIETAQAQAHADAEVENGPNARPSSMVDRPEMALDLLKCELDFQFAKVELVEKHLEAYEHIYDPLEAVRCLQMVVDLMASRPRLNMEATLYCDAYASETELLRQKLQFFTDLSQLQVSLEQEENKASCDFQELKTRRVSEAVAKEYQLGKLEKVARFGSDEQDVSQVSDEQFKMEQQIAAKLEGMQAKKDAIKEIQKKHITEYANEQYSNFAQVLGLPEISMEDLANKRDQREPLIQDAVREQAFFTKQLEGYPAIFSDQKEAGVSLGLRVAEVGMLDFYESLSIVPKVNAALAQACEHLADALKPENGLASSVLEVGLLKEARLCLAELIQVREQGGLEGDSQGSGVVVTPGQNYIEDDFFLASSDKLVFAMKEFKAEMDPVNLYKTADPLVVSKLDYNSVKNYNFPRINVSEVRASLEGNRTSMASRFIEEQANDAIVRKMIELAKESCARTLLEKRDRIEQPCDDDDDDAYLLEDDKTVRSPSMMRMACNVLEVVRLREQLIQRISECNELTKIYHQQCALVSRNKDTSHPEAINFNISSILKEQINIVDSNHGKNLEFGLAFAEFDGLLGVNLDLKSTSCVKALMTDLGVEELRGILKYQLMQQQLLMVAVQTNQLLLDGPCRGLKELELLEEKSVVVPNPVLKLTSFISATSDGQNIAAMKQERQRLKQCVATNQNLMYFVLTRKARDRDTVMKKFTKMQTRLVQSQKFRPEETLRLLRSYRLKLLHEYADTVTQEIYLDAIKLQCLQTANLLRLKAALLPTGQTRLFTLGKGSVQENLSCFSSQHLFEESLMERQTLGVKDILSGQIINSGLFYVPHSEEIVFTDRLQVDQMQLRQQEWLDQAEASFTDFDVQIKAFVKRPRMLNEPFQPGISRLREQAEARDKRGVATNTVLPQNRVMSQIQAMAGATYKRQEETRLQMYKVEEGAKNKYGFRKVTFMEAHSYASKDIFKLLQYMSLVLRIFTLEYLMGRNNTPAKQILELEQKVLTGQEFWTAVDRMKVVQDINTLRYGDHSDQIKHRLIENETASDRVIDRILERKKVWQELREDMDIVKERVARVDELAKGLPHERRTIGHLLDLLVLQHQATFYQYLNGIENIMEIYRDKGQDEQFFKVMEVRNLATKRHEGMVLNLRNGFFISQASVNPCHISLGSSDVSEFNQFMQQQHPVVDERALVPTQVAMLQRVYGVCADLDAMSRDSLLEPWAANYASLQNSLFNFDDEQRSFIGTNFPQLDEVVKDYLVYKGILEADKAKPQAQGALNSSRTGDSTEQAAPKQSLRKGMNYSSESLLATVEILSFKIEAAHMQRVLMGWISGEGRIPSTTAEYTRLMRKFQDITTMRILQEREHLNEVYFLGERATSQLDETKSEARHTPETVKRDKSLILEPEKRKTAKFAFFDKVNLIRAETNVIKRLLDQKLILIGTRMIRNEHAALVAAIDFAGSEDTVQQFVHPQQQFAATLLGDVDRLSHLDIVNKLGFVQQFLTRLRNRCTEVETLTSGPGIVFSMKDFNECVSIFCKQALKHGEESLRERSETSALISNQYRHLLYLKEMEVIYFREKCEQFLRNIDVIVNTKMSAKGNQMIYELDVTNRELRSLKDHYYLMERFMRDEIKKEFLTNIATKENSILKLQDDFGDYRTKMQHELLEECATEINDADERFKVKKGSTGAQRSFNRPTAEQLARQQAVPENYQTILRLERYIRQSKVLNMMKQVLAEEKHQKEIKELQLKLTLNASLWEQLSESQKRESITRQELELTKRNLTHYEKLIERLYVQLEQLNNEKVRLQRYKTTKAKKINELEDKMKDLEILENIDLDKILTEMRLRDKKIERLEQVDNQFHNRLGSQEAHAALQFKNVEKLLAAERQAKNEAFAKLESMRVEMKALEGTDIKNDLWKDKCKELHDISKELEHENEGLRKGLKSLQVEKVDLQRLNETLVYQRKSLQHHQASAGGPLIDSTEHTLADSHLPPSTTSRNTGFAGANPLRENMILNRKALVKPMTAKAGAYGNKRTQSGNPGAARVNNRLYARNMANAQSYHYDRSNEVGTMGAGPHQGTGPMLDPLQQTLMLSNASYPAFSSDIDHNSIGGQRNPMMAKNMTLGVGPNVGGAQSRQTGTSSGQHRYSMGAQPGTMRMPTLSGASNHAKKHQMNGRGYARSTHAMNVTGATPHGVQGHGGTVLMGSALPTSGTFSSVGQNINNSGLNLATGPMTVTPGSGSLNLAVESKGSRLHTSQGQRGVGSRARGGNAANGSSRGLFVSSGGARLQASQLHNNAIGFVDQHGEPAALNIQSKQVALQSVGHNELDANQVHMQQEMKNLLQNSSAVAQFTHGDFNNQRPPQPEEK